MLDKFFKISERGSTVSNEVIGGLTTFLAMAYIIAVNPAMMEAAGIPFNACLLYTSILAGMAIAVFWKQPTRGRVQTGIAFSGKKVLQAAVVLLGFGLNLAQIAQVGMMSLPIIGSTIATALIVAFLLHKVLRMPSEISTLIGVGSSICGGSAIAATAPVIKAVSYTHLGRTRHSTFWETCARWPHDAPSHRSARAEHRVRAVHALHAGRCV